MRRLMIGIIVVGIVLSAGVSSARQKGAAMPERVRTFLDNVTGRWTVGGSTQGTNEVRWDATGMVLIDTGQFEEPDLSGSWTGVWYWDGVSEDAIIVSWGSPTSHGFGYGQLHGKVLSPTVMEAQRTGVRQGKPVTENVRVEFQSLDQYTWTSTNITVGGEKQPDYTEIYTRVKTASAEEELIKLEHELAEALVERDIEVIDRINADGMSLGTPEGTFITKKDVLDYVRSDKFDLDSLVCEDLNAKVYGDMAVVTGKLRWTDKKGNRRRDLITDVFLRRGGRWQMVATHESQIEEAIDSAILSPEMKKLALFVGRWEYEGEQVDPPVAGLPFGPAGKFSGTVKTRFVLGGQFQESKIEDHNPGGTTTVVSLTGYDAKAKQYFDESFTSEGSRETATSTISNDGRTWTNRATTTTKDGKRILVRSVTKYAPDGDTYTGTTEVSPDNGKTWKHWFSEKGKRMKK